MGSIFRFSKKTLPQVLVAMNLFCVSTPILLVTVPYQSAFASGQLGHRSFKRPLVNSQTKRRKMTLKQRASRRNPEAHEVSKIAEKPADKFITPLVAAAVPLENQLELPLVAFSNQTYATSVSTVPGAKLVSENNESEEFDEEEEPEEVLAVPESKPTASTATKSTETTIPKAFVSLGVATPAYGIVVEKATHQLHLFQLTPEGTYNRFKTYRAITGKDPGDKAAKGDLRTPEGIYFVDSEVARSRLTDKYGAAAFTLDYPNIFDQRRRKSGSGIWIHATNYPKRLKNPYDTEGCVVVSNKDILDLKKYIQPFKVPVVITKKMETTTEFDIVQPRAKASELIESWRKNWVESEFEGYMALYSENFRTNGKNKQQWRNYKESLSVRREKNIRVTLSDIKILAFQDQLLVTFFQDYSSNQHADYGRKFVYLQWEKDQYRIISEKWYPQQKVTNLLSAEEKRPF